MPAMTVEQLIARLRGLDPSLPVRVRSQRGDDLDATIVEVVEIPGESRTGHSRRQSERYVRIGIDPFGR